MIESPLLDQIVKEAVDKARRSVILSLLEVRFGVLPVDLASQLDVLTGEEQLHELVCQAALCPDLAAFLSKIANP
jgi:hypothetical protein